MHNKPICTHNYNKSDIHITHNKPRSKLHNTNHQLTQLQQTLSPNCLFHN